MKAYRKFKLPEAAGPAAKVANPAKIRTPDPETLANLATLAAGNAQTTNLDRQLKECAPPQLNEAEIEERKGMASDSVPEPYLDAWARFQLQCPGGVTEQAWRQAIDDAGRFLDQWGKLADSFGWTPGNLFDVPRDGAMGLAWWLKGRTVSALGPEHACVGQDRVTRREWVNPYARPVRPVSLSPILERQRDIMRRLFPGRLDEGNK